MKKFLNITALFTLFLSISCFAQPKIEVVGGDTYNWGTVKPADNPLKATVVIKNAGTEDLNITNVKPGCGCTTAPISKNNLAPGDTASLSITLNISGNSSAVTKSINISSNDPKSPNKYLYIKADIYTPLHIKPTQYFTFNDMQVGVKKDAALKVKNNSDHSITLSDFKTSTNTVTLNIMGTKILKPGEEFDIIATATPDKVGYFNTSVKFKTNDPDMKEVSLTAYGNVKESILNK